MSALRGRARNRVSFEAQIAGQPDTQNQRRGRSSSGRGGGGNDDPFFPPPAPGRPGARTTRAPSPDITAPSSGRTGVRGAGNAINGPSRPSPRGRIVHERGGGSGTRATSSTSRGVNNMPTYVDSDESDDEQGEEEEDSSDVETSKKKGKGKGRRATPGKDKKGKEKDPMMDKSGQKQGVRSGVTLTSKEMVHNSLLYFLLMQHKKHPVKKSDIIKHAMNDQGKAFPDTMKELSSVFDRVLGMKVHGLESTAKTGEFSSYMLTSNFNLSVSDIVTERNADVDYKRSILFLILSIIFMLNRSIEEDTIWKIITELQLHEPTEVVEEDDVDEDDCNGVNTHINYITKREDLARFLKKEYISTMYLRSETEQNITRYSWGKRAEKEFSKYAILKFVCKYFPGKKPCDFMDQYNIVQELEKEAVEEDIALDERTSADMDNDREALAEALGDTPGGPDTANMRGRRRVDDHRDSSPEKSLSKDTRKRGRVVTSLEEAETETEELVTPARGGGGGRGRGSTVGSVRGSVKNSATGNTTDSSTSPDRRGGRKRRAIIESDDESETDTTRMAVNGVTSPTRGRPTRRSGKSS